MCIPVTNPDISEAALIMDAFSYMTYKDVLPVYYDVSLSQKGLRNEDSIEMLISSATRAISTSASATAGRIRSIRRSKTLSRSATAQSRRQLRRIKKR